MDSVVRIERLEKERGWIWIAYNESKPIGWISVSEIEGQAIGHDLWSDGSEPYLALRLYKKVMAFAKEKGYKEAFINMQADQIGSKIEKLYMRDGWTLQSYMLRREF